MTFPVLRNLLILVLVVAACGGALAQSSDQNFPTPVTSSELDGVIKARDMGDARLTTHFYVFEGGLGDIFINVVAKNFTGDIDVFGAEDLRPLAKMTIYADVGVTENGRLIYLRKPERLLLRVEGRTPGDDTATYRIKFAGSFVALAPTKEEPPPTIAQEKTDNLADDQAELNPKPKPKKIPAIVPVKTDDETATSDENAKPKPDRERVTKPVVVVDDYPGLSESETKRKDSNETTKPVSKATGRKRPAPKPDPLANIRLVISMKDGSVIERSMGEIQRFSFDKGVLTVIAKSGKMTSYAMTDIASVNLQ